MTDMQLQTVQTVVPALTIEEAVQRFNELAKFTSTIMKRGIDYGVIPGSDKPTLLKPGAEKLCTFFALVPRFSELEVVEDWTGEEHGGEPFFYYKTRCRLYHGDRIVAEQIASINSWEKKFRYRSKNRSCPECGKETIYKSKQKPEFYCWKKMGGCGFIFPLNDERITKQEEGQGPNKDIFDSVNTLQKQAQKRAMVGATLIGANASEYYTQDIDDLAIEGNWSEAQPATKPENGQVKDRATEAMAEKVRATQPERVYSQSEIGPDFDGPPPLDPDGNEIPVKSKPAPTAQKPVIGNAPRADVDPATGEVIKPKAEAPKADAKKPAAKPGEMTVSPQYIEGALTYQDQNGHKMVQWGKGWKPAQATFKGADKADEDKVVDAMLSLFPDEKTGKPNVFYARNHLKKHFKVEFWKSLTWEQMASVVAAQKHQQYDSRWYPEEAANQLGMDGHPEEAEVILANHPDTFDVLKYYDLPAGTVAGIDESDIQSFVSDMNKLPDKTVLKVLLEGGLKASDPHQFNYFSSLSTLLASGDLKVGTPDFNDMVNYAIEEGNAK